MFFAEILDEDGKRKQILFYDLEQNTSKVYDYDRQIAVHIELHGDLAVFYLHDTPVEVNIVDLKEG